MVDRYFTKCRSCHRDKVPGRTMCKYHLTKHKLRSRWRRGRRSDGNRALTLPIHHDPGREARIKAYADRAALMLPLFEDGPPQVDPAGYYCWGCGRQAPVRNYLDRIGTGWVATHLPEISTKCHEVLCPSCITVAKEDRVARLHASRQGLP